jgi:hypothetical protein
MTDARSIDGRFRAWPRPVSIEDVSARRRPAAQPGGGAAEVQFLGSNREFPDVTVRD